MALAKDELELLQEHQSDLSGSRNADEEMLAFYRGTYNLEHIGIAVPEVMQYFAVKPNWGRVYANAKDDRMQVRSIILPGEEQVDDRMLLIMERSKLDTQVSKFNIDRMTFGRGHLVMGRIRPRRENDGDGPVVVWSASPMGMSTFVDSDGFEESAAQFSKKRDGTECATLYLPDSTLYLEMGTKDWEVVDRDNHNLGVVPVVTHFNRAMSDRSVFESELTDIMPITHAAARALTILQLAQDTVGAPFKYISKVDKGFKDEGIPELKLYLNAINVFEGDAVLGQLDPANLANFTHALKVYGEQMMAITGLPGKYWGITTSNPQSEGAIIESENQFVRDVESDCEQLGETIGRAFEVAWRIETGQELDFAPNVEWHDPATPTVAQRADAMMKLHSVGALAIEGIWDELGWSEAKKKKQRAYLEDERALSVDPTLGMFANMGLPAFQAEPDAEPLRAQPVG